MRVFHTRKQEQMIALKLNIKEGKPREQAASVPPADSAVEGRTRTDFSMREISSQSGA